MTESPGQRLRATREARGQTLEDVERVTRIRARHLMALEADEYEALPSLTQARGFLKNYAQHLGRDPDELVQLYDASSRRSILPVLRIPGARASARAASQVAAPEPARKPARRKAAKAASPRPAPGAPKVRARGPRIFSADVLVAVVITTVLVSLLVWGGSQLALGAGAEPTATRSSIVAIVTAGPTATFEVPVETTPTDAPALPNTAFSGVNVTVHAEQRTWVGVRVDGVEIYAGLMPPGEAREFVAQNVVEVSTGNARGTRVVYNGADQGTLGGVGEVVIRLWTLQGMQTPTASPTAAQE